MDFANPDVLARFLQRDVVPLEEQLRGIVKPAPPVIILKRHLTALHMAVYDSLEALMGGRVKLDAWEAACFGNWSSFRDSYRYRVWPSRGQAWHRIASLDEPTWLDEEFIDVSRHSSGFLHHPTNQWTTDVVVNITARWPGAPRESVGIGFFVPEFEWWSLRISKTTRDQWLPRLTHEAMGLIGEKWWPRTPRMHR